MEDLLIADIEAGEVIGKRILSVYLTFVIVEPKYMGEEANFILLLYCNMLDVGLFLSHHVRTFNFT